MDANKSLDERSQQRQALLQARRAWTDTPEAARAQQALQARVLEVLAQLEPQCLGLYWPMPGEFNPRGVATTAQQALACQLALPYARKSPVQMHYRPWDGQTPGARDECGIPAPDGRPVLPDVVLVPCVGFTREGWRLGYGGGYFDRFLGAHPGVTAVGVAWEAGLLPISALQPRPHDIPLVMVLTECNTWCG